MPLEIPTNAEHVIVLSDLHLSAPPLSNFFAWKKLYEFFEQLEENVLLILAGDIFDFLNIEDRKNSLILAEIPAIMTQLFKQIKEHTLELEKSEIEPKLNIFRAWGNFLKRGGQCIIMPGNHDPELVHPEAKNILLSFFDSKDMTFSKNLHFHIKSEPLKIKVNPWSIIINHGHRTDPFNDINFNELRTAINNNDLEFPFPPGSKIVLETLNPLKNISDNQKNFLFVDKLHPTSAVILMLLHMGIPNPFLKGTLKNIFNGIKKQIKNQISTTGPTLNSTKNDNNELNETIEQLGIKLGNEIFETLEENEKNDFTLQQIDNHINNDIIVSSHAESLSSSNLSSLILKSILKILSKSNFFNHDQLTDHDNNIINSDSNWDSDSEFCIILNGHTHAARIWQSEDKKKTYINTGTWTELIKIPSMIEYKHWIDNISRGNLEQLKNQQLTYARIQKSGPTLNTFR